MEKSNNTSGIANTKVFNEANLVRTCQGCKRDILARDYCDHINKCLKFMIECSYCGGNMPKVKYL